MHVNQDLLVSGCTRWGTVDKDVGSNKRKGVTVSQKVNVLHGGGAAVGKGLYWVSCKFSPQHLWGACLSAVQGPWKIKSAKIAYTTRWEAQGSIQEEAAILQGDGKNAGCVRWSVGRDDRHWTNLDPLLATVWIRSELLEKNAQMDELQRTEINFLSAPEAEKIETSAPGRSRSRYSTSAQWEKRRKEGKRRENEWLLGVLNPLLLFTHGGGLIHTPI